MKSYICQTLTVLGLAGLTAFATSVSADSTTSEFHTAVTIKSDGTCLLRVEEFQSRPNAEQRVRMMERNKKRAQMAEEGDDADMPPPAEIKDEPEPKPLSDDELAKKIREMADPENQTYRMDLFSRLETVEVSKDTVRTVMTNAFDSVKAMFEQGRAWTGQAISFRDVRFEKDTNSHLRLTFSPYSSGRYRNSMRSHLQLTGTKHEFKLTLPGKVLSSGFSNVQDNVTWYVIDPQKEETLDAAVKMSDAPIVITAELGGLSIDQPIDSKTARRKFRYGASEEPDVPITEGASGYSAEAMSLTTSTVYLFPEGVKRSKDNDGMDMEKPGIRVQAKLFAPKDRDMQSVSDVRVLKAVDDKGRSIEKAKTEEDEDSFGGTFFSHGNRETKPMTSMQVELQLPLPEPDAQAIQELSAEAVVTSVGSWKEITITNFQQNATNEVDLSEILPGAKIVLTKYTPKKSRISVDAELKGPSQISQVKVVGKFDSEHSSSHAMERGTKKKGGQMVRKISIQGYTFSSEDEEPGPFVLLVRYPQDIRRDRVQFNLSALDLF